MGYSQKNSGTITGYFNLSLGQKAIYTASANAQCGNCYDWDINEEVSNASNAIASIKINGSDMGKTIEIEAISVGQFQLDLSYIDEDGYHKQSFTGNVIYSNESCDYAFSVSEQYKDVANAENEDTVLLTIESNYPAGTNYTWTIFKQDGTYDDYASVLDKSIKVTATSNNRIVRATVTAEYLDCTKTETKNFIHAIPIIDQLGNLFPECTNPIIDSTLLSQTDTTVLKNKKNITLANNNKE